MFRENVRIPSRPELLRIKANHSRCARVTTANVVIKLAGCAGIRLNW